MLFRSLGGLDDKPAEIKANGGAAPVTFPYSDYGVNQVGYCIAANADTIGALADLKMITRANSSGYVEQIIYDLITSGRYRGHLKRLTGRIEAATQQAYDSLSRLGLPVFGEPRGGFYMWCELPHHIDDKYLSRVAAERSILLAPGSAFNPDATPNRPAMRVNIAHVGDPRFHQFMMEHRASS